LNLRSGETLPQDVLWALEEFALPTAGAVARRAPTGLIQLTFLVALVDGRQVVVQRMHPIFGAAVLDDIDAVTAHLERSGMATPRPFRTPEGALCVSDADGRLWRVLTFLEGHTVDRVERPALAGEAGGLVARFHRAMDGWAREFSFVRAGVHDTAKHLGRLEAALAAGGEGPRQLGEAILAQAHALPPLAGLPRRVAHGDLKISNVLFQGGQAVALLDLDTLGRMSVAYELGDAWRSWCNPLGEDVEATRFDLDVFAAAVRGYAAGAGGLLAREEIDALVPGVETVCVELAARFCVDAFEDRYFGWDPARFPSRREHNRVRAAGQLELARAVAAARGDAERIVLAAFTS
jgi:Ser/Thr protein kinase RdoA (MazF antagonist)